MPVLGSPSGADQEGARPRAGALGRRRAGSKRLRALIVFDEVYGYLPPHPAELSETTKRLAPRWFILRNVHSN